MKRLPLPFVLAIAGCGGGGETADDMPTVDAPTGADAAVDAAAGCPRDPGPDDRARHVVVARPYDVDGNQANTWEVLDLSISGDLTRPTPRRFFTMGRASFGTIAFTPDGEIGLVAQDDGTVGVFALDAAGVPSVVHAGFDGGFYASGIAIDPSGDRAWVIDGNWRKNGGGIYGVTIGCDGTLTSTGLAVAAKLPAAIAFAGGHAIIAATDVADSAAGDDVHAVTWGGTPEAVSGADAFGAEDPIVGGAALTADGATFLVGDVSQFSGVANRVAVVRVDGATVTPVSVISPVDDPQSIVASPFGDVAVVASAFGDALVVLDTGGPAGAWRVRGEVPYTSGNPLLPGDLAMIERGTLRGHVLVSENVSIRHLAFRANGDVDDLDALAFGSGLDQIPGAIGVTP
jgi:hypothetical protein